MVLDRVNFEGGQWWLNTVFTRRPRECGHNNRQFTGIFCFPYLLPDDLEHHLAHEADAGVVWTCKGKSPFALGRLVRLISRGSGVDCDLKRAPSRFGVRTFQRRCRPDSTCSPSTSRTRMCSWRKSWFVRAGYQRPMSNTPLSLPRTLVESTLRAQLVRGCMDSASR